MKSLLFRGHSIKYLEAGRGPSMVFLHNGGSGHWIWKYQIEYFARTHRVLAPDLLGCGQSDRPTLPYDLNLYADLVHGFLESLGLHEVILVGNCVGAAAALESTMRDPSRVSALILFNLCGGPHMMHPMVRLVSSGASLPRGLENGHRWMLNFFSRLPGVRRSALRTNYGIRAPNRQDPVYMAESLEAANPAQAQPRINLIRGLPSFNKFSHDFPRPAVLPPTYVIWGEKNRVLPARKGARFCERLRPDRREFVPGAGHMVMSEEHAHVNAAMTDFLLTAQR
jgi:pimeloyl-ACP methyl ester carboxylesterase